MREHLHTLGLVLVIAFWVVLLPGCSEEDQITDSDSGATAADQTVDLNDPYGGFLAVDEDPAFGNDDLAGSTTLEEEVENGYAGLSEEERRSAENMEENHKRGLYSLTVLWGNLEDQELSESNVPPVEADAVIWDGTLSLREGAIRLLRLIRFERPEDRILPRVGSDSLSWTSVTHGGYDGLRVLLVVPTDSSGIPVNDALTFYAEPFGRITLSIADLEEFDEVYDVPNSVEQVSIRAWRADPTVDSRGFCGGRWGWAANDSTGHFVGRWVEIDGRLAGYMRGHYGENDEGQQVFFGKYVDRWGRFRGFLRGRYEIIRDAEIDLGGSGVSEIGSFNGEWVGKHGHAFGRLSGHWSRRGERPGLFSGVWVGHYVP